MTNKMSEYKTLTGLSIEEALVLMKKVLPPEAYSGVPGATNFTDIDPAYLTQVATDAFGACGLGWFYTYSPESISMELVHKTSSKGREYDTYDCLINYMELVYAYVDVDDVVRYSTPIVTNGGSNSEDRSYALRGAITNGIGSAFAKLLWQIGVYKGIVTHTNAKAWYDKQEGKVAQKTPAETKTTTTTATPATTTTTEPVSGKVEKPTEMQEKAPASKGKGKVEEKEIGADLTLVVPDGIGVPVSGQTLEQVCKNQIMGEAVLKFLTGEYNNASGHKFVPEGEQQLALQDAAKKILASGNYAKPNKTKAA